MDSKGFYNHQSNLPICGTAPVIICMEFCKYFGIKNSKLLYYSLSGDVSGDYNNSVSYASILFR
jgi:AmmeMemoRadiSam system protein B